MKKLTELQYKQILTYKSLSDKLQDMQNELYQRIVEITESDSDWLFEYFFNDDGDLNETLEKIMNIEVEK